MQYTVSVVLLYSVGVSIFYTRKFYYVVSDQVCLVGSVDWYGLQISRLNMFSTKFTKNKKIKKSLSITVPRDFHDKTYIICFKFFRWPLKNFYGEISCMSVIQAHF